MRPTLLCPALVLTFCLAAAARAADEPLVLDVWPGKVPGATEPAGEDKVTGEKPRRQVTSVTRPTLTVYRPAKDKDTGVAVIIAPGGGYRFLSLDLEGEEVASWLNSIGVTGIILRYRVPSRSGETPFGPLQDAQRALSLVRSKAEEWGLRPDRIGMLGFSAGGHLTALAATHFEDRSYEPEDGIDKVSCRPDFAVIIYPGGVVRRGEMSPDVKVTKETPPTFLAQAGDDRVGVENSVQLYLALERAGVPAELHVYATGGHGFGLRPGKHPAPTSWPKRCEEWLRDQGLLPAEAGR